MTTEDKELIIKDLTRRLPYGVKILWDGAEGKQIVKLYNIKMYGYIDDYILNGLGQPEPGYEYDIRINDEIKIYLRSLKQMTDEENEYHNKLLKDLKLGGNIDLIVNFYLEHHIDYLGLIYKGLAIEAPKGMYFDEESKSEIYVPKTIEEAFIELDKCIVDEDKEYLIDVGSIAVHHSFGRWIRNNWGLWEEDDNELKAFLKGLGYEHPDDMSDYIITEYIKHLQNDTERKTDCV